MMSDPLMALFVLIAVAWLAFMLGSERGQRIRLQREINLRIFVDGDLLSRAMEGSGLRAVPKEVADRVMN